MEEILDVFIQEAREQLAEMEAGLMRMEQGDHDPETLNGGGGPHGSLVSCISLPPVGGLAGLATR